MALVTMTVQYWCVPDGPQFVPSRGKKPFRQLRAASFFHLWTLCDTERGVLLAVLAAADEATSGVHEPHDAPECLQLPPQHLWLSLARPELPAPAAGRSLSLAG